MGLFDKKEPSTVEGATVVGAEAGKALAKEAVAKPAKVRAKPVRRLPANPLSIIHVNTEKVAKYKGARKAFADKLKEGKTIEQYHAAGGDNGFLRFFVNDGAVTFTEVPAAPKPEKVKTTAKNTDGTTATA